ncbi:protein hsr-9 [Aplysia californica]|uniref:Protein hsr-9 n=1 Tax=Aplysia californica TaxID=6500 RepID=A0ABM0JDQ9_APLCA|nr:protein hsr-9 [Aplysia californica]
MSVQHHQLSSSRQNDEPPFQNHESETDGRTIKDSNSNNANVSASENYSRNHGLSVKRAGERTPKRQSRRVSEAKYPGSGSKTTSKRSFRTPVQILPLLPSNDVRKSASKSFIMMPETGDQDTPRTHIEAFLANVNSVEAKTVRNEPGPSVSAQQSARRHSPRKQMSRDSFKVPTSHSLLRKSFPSVDMTPSSKLTPRTHIWNLVNAGEEQTPVTRVAVPADTSAPDNGADLRTHSGLGQEVSMSPITKSSESEFREDFSSRSGYQKKAARRSFHLLSDEHAETEQGQYPLSQGGQEVHLSPMSNLQQSEILDSSASPSERSKRTARRSFRIPFSADMDPVLNKTTEKKLTPGQEVSSPRRSNRSVENWNTSALHSKDKFSISDTSAKSSKEQNNLEDASFEERSEKDVYNDLPSDERSSAVVADASNRKREEQEVLADASSSGIKNRSAIKSMNASSFHGEDELTDMMDISKKSRKETNVLSDAASPRRSDRSVNNTNTSLSNGQNRSLNQADATTYKSSEGHELSAGTSSPERMNRSSMNRKADSSRGTDRASNVFDALSKSNKEQEFLADASSKKSIYDISDNSIEDTFRTPTARQLKRGQSRDTLSASRSVGEGARSTPKTSGNKRKLTPSSTRMSDLSKKRKEGDQSDMLALDPRSSTPLKRSKSFFHSTKRQSAMAAYLSNAEDFAAENVSMGGLPDISPIRPYSRSALGGDGDHVEAAEPEEIPEYSSRSKARSVPSASKEQTEMQDDSTDDEHLGQYSPLKTPHIDMNVRKEVSTLHKKQGRLRPVNLIENTNMQSNQPKEGLSQKRRVRRTPDTTLPRRSVKFFAQRHSSSKLSNDALEEIEHASETFWANTFKALEVFALHAGRKTVNEEDVILLMKTQGIVNSTRDLHDLIREYLPMELRSELIPVAKP